MADGARAARWWRGAAVALLCAALQAAALQPGAMAAGRGGRHGGARVAGGHEAGIEQHPYLAQLLVDLGAGAGLGFQYACAGSILTAFFTLTAASCFLEGGGALVAWRGRYGSSSSAFGGSVVAIFSVAPHPEYARTYDADVAVARVQVGLTYADGIQPGVFAGAGTLLPDTLHGTLLGWGDHDEAGSRSQWLQAAGVATLPRDECARRLGRELSARQACGAGVEAGVGACAGDGGAPLVAQGAVVALVSRAGGACVSSDSVLGAPDDTPDLYTLVPAVIEWVADYIATQS